MAKQKDKNIKNRIFAQKRTFLSYLIAFFALIHQKKCLFTLFWLFPIVIFKGQSIDGDVSIQTQIQAIIEDFTEFNNGGEDFDFNTLYEDLLLISQSKLDLNTATAAQLQRLFFLTETNIQSIVDYRTTYGDFLSIYELQSVPGLSPEQLNSLKLFVSVKSDIRPTRSSSTIEALERQKNQLFLKWKSLLETPVGFQEVAGNPPRFAGDKNYFYLRYSHLANDGQWGLIFEKDPGESFTNTTAELGIDYISFHYQKNNLSPLIQQLNLGDFTVNLGQGLISHGAFGLGKSTFTTQVKKSRPGLRRFNSVAENQSFRGLGMALGNDRSKISGIIFASYQARDANLTGVNELGFETFSSLPDNGLHRSEGEREDQDALYETSFGGALNFQPNTNIKVGFNGVHHQFSQFREFAQQPYQLFRWAGNRLLNLSTDYSVLVDGWNFFGEIARSENHSIAFANIDRPLPKGWAQIHGLVKSLDAKFDMSLVYRDYGKDYNALFANAFGERFTASNEKGIYLGFEYRPSREWTIRGFADQWRNEWLQFRVDGPSTGREYLLRVDYAQKRKRLFYIQYRYETKGENSEFETLVDRPVARRIQRLRLHGNYKIGSGIELRSRIEFSNFQKEDRIENGIFIYQDFIKSSTRSPLRISARLGYFNISDFDARIYTYENDLLYEYFIPSFSGEGLRYYANFRYRISYKLMAEMRFEQTNFFGAEFISSGTNLIVGNTSSRLKAQIRWTF